MTTLKRVLFTDQGTLTRNPSTPIQELPLLSNAVAFY